MKSKRSKNKGNFEIITTFIILIFFVAWAANVYKLIKCDFKEPYKSEIVYGVGVIVGPAAIITVWFESD